MRRTIACRDTGRTRHGQPAYSALTDGIAVSAGVGDPDRDLVAGVGRGDRRALESLLRRHYDGMHRIA